MLYARDRASPKWDQLPGYSRHSKYFSVQSRASHLSPESQKAANSLWSWGYFQPRVTWTRTTTNDRTTATKNNAGITQAFALENIQTELQVHPLLCGAQGPPLFVLTQNSVAPWGSHQPLTPCLVSFQLQIWGGEGSISSCI